MDKTPDPAPAMQLFLYWFIVGVPLVWGVWKTLAKLPALFQ